MTMISHKPTSPEAYQIFAGKEQVGFARKTDEGFYYEGLDGSAQEFKTMRDLKLGIGEFQGVEDRANRKPFYITVDDLRARFGLSHSSITSHLKFMHQAYPWLRKEQLGAAIAKVVLAERVKWEYACYDQDRKWLAAHRHELPKLPVVDWDYFNANNKVRYVGKETW